MTLPAQHFGADGNCPEPNFESFFERWYPPVLSYSRRFGAAHAEEIAQETLFRAFSRFSDLRHDMPLPWLRTVARNVACDLHRAGKRLGPLPEAGEADPADLSEGPEESLLRLERVGHMRAAFGDISPEDRKLLHMSVIDEHSVDAIADQLAVTANTVRVRLHRARRRLGTQYMRRAGHQALVLPAFGFAVLRRLLRPTASTATRSAPALVAVAALSGLTAATLVLTQPNLPVQHVWSTAATDQQPYRHAPSVAVQRQSVTAVPAARPAQHVMSTTPAPALRTSGPTVKTRVPFSDPEKPGTWVTTDVFVTTPAGTFGTSYRIWRGEGPGAICYVTHHLC